jgi:peptide/nickel transport system ATP-binding protein
MADGDIILEIEGLRIESASGAAIVENIDLILHRGEVLGLIGESGAGKTTIGLAALAYARGGCRIAGGRVRLGGRDLLTLESEGRRQIRGARVAYVAQSAAAAFNPAMRLVDQVCEAPVRHGLMSRAEARRRAVVLFRSLELPDPENFGARYPHQVSGGQLQRAMAAMAMITGPDILVLDEPTTALDVTTQIEVLAVLKKLIRQHGTAGLYITHDLAVVAQIADRIMVLRHGREVELGTAAQILQAPRTDYARALVAERKAATAGTPAVAASRAEPVLAIDAASVAYGGLTAVDKVSFSVARGETVAVVGESGSGKTSLAMAITGLVGRDGGDIRFDGKSLAPSYRQRSADERRRLQLICQMPDTALNPRQRVADIIGRPIAFYFKARGRDLAARVAALLGQVGLPAEFAARRPGELSGGQKQRVCIARALAAEPDLVICDEVTSALDPLVAEEILALLRRLQDELGLAYLFITHDLGTVRRVAHRVAIMLRGALVAEGPTAEVFRAPDHPYTRKLLASVPEMRTDWLDEVLQQRPEPPAASPGAAGGRLRIVGRA